MIAKRIALVGASSTGKTTAYELLKAKVPEYVFINESTRTVKKYGFPINEQGTDGTQLAISSFHLKALLQPYSLILDRCYMDLVVYTNHVKVSHPTYTFIEDMWEQVKEEYTHYVYFPIEFEPVNDGIRSVDIKWRNSIDLSFQDCLADVSAKKLTVTGSPMQRVEQILDFIK